MTRGVCALVRCMMCSTFHILYEKDYRGYRQPFGPSPFIVHDSIIHTLHDPIRQGSTAVREAPLLHLRVCDQKLIGGEHSVGPSKHGADREKEHCCDLTSPVCKYEEKKIGTG